MPKSRSKRNPKQPPQVQRPPRSGLSYRAGMRPPWHRAVGWSMIVIGVVIIVLNDLAYADIELMPGGHSALYLLLGLLVAGFGS